MLTIYEVLQNFVKISFFLWLISVSICASAQTSTQQHALDFYEQTFNFESDASVHIKYDDTLSNQTIKQFYKKLDAGNYQNLVKLLLDYKETHHLNDWLYYQLIRKTAEELSPKKANYHRYTLYKWFLMVKSGYDAQLAIGNNQLIFYIRNDEDIADIPFFMVNGKKYMCLNYHDYGKLFKNATAYQPVNLNIEEGRNNFSYKITKLPDFKADTYIQKELLFNYNHKAYHFNIKLNKELEGIFKNYPVVDFESYFNIPLSRETYQSLIPLLKENVRKMNTKKGVDYLMNFTRYAFLYENDDENFGKEKRLSPEETLISKYSDCDDRAALFFYLVKEIYNLPMIALLYPTHITMAIQFDKPIGDVVVYNGRSYSVCEPTPQKQVLKIGQIATEYKDLPYQVVYAYMPNVIK